MGRKIIDLTGQKFGRLTVVERTEDRIEPSGKRKEEQFKIQQEHDKRKREYAEKNGYKLLEIWYYDYDKIEEILSRELSI